MDQKQRISAFVKLGSFFNNFLDWKSQKQNIDLDQEKFNEFNQCMRLASVHNAWFTEDHLEFALKQWSKALTENNIKKWLSHYNTHIKNPKTIAIIMAGNIPLVGFHDFLCVLLTGHFVLVKQSSNDEKLLPFIARFLKNICPHFKITFTKDQIKGFDAVIATGSNNTSRYFEYYFKNKPSILRRNRNSVAVLTGEETIDELKLLSEDIFRYYGLGCRNVSKLFVPVGYNFDLFFNAVYEWKDIIYDHKYANNYDYNKAVYLMSEFDILDNGFLMLKEDKKLSSPIATLFYETYQSKDELNEKLDSLSNQIQSMVGKAANQKVPFGQTQHPKLWDYADNIDTVEFLLTI